MPELKTAAEIRDYVEHLCATHGAQEIGCRLIALVQGRMTDIATFSYGDKEPYFRPCYGHALLFAETDGTAVQLERVLRDDVPPVEPEPGSADQPTAPPTDLSVDPEPHTDPVEPGSDGSELGALPTMTQLDLAAD